MPPRSGHHGGQDLRRSEPRTAIPHGLQGGDQCVLPPDCVQRPRRPPCILQVRFEDECRLVVGDGLIDPAEFLLQRAEAHLDSRRAGLRVEPLEGRQRLRQPTRTPQRCPHQLRLDQPWIRRQNRFQTLEGEVQFAFLQGLPRPLDIPEDRQPLYGVRQPPVESIAFRRGIGGRRYVPKSLELGELVRVQLGALGGSRLRKPSRDVDGPVMQHPGAGSSPARLAVSA